MKKQFIVTAILIGCATIASSQEDNTRNRINVTPNHPLLLDKYKVQKQDDRLKKFSLPDTVNNSFSLLPNGNSLMILPQDNMPCIIPSTENYAMPNPAPPLRFQNIPNPAKPLKRPPVPKKQ